MLAEDTNETDLEDIKMTTTSDGISLEDWEVLHELAVNIVNASAEEDDAMGRIYKRHLFEYLDTLETKYGPLPSILDTRADYTDDPEIRRGLYSQAYTLAKDRGDVRNQLYIASSLGRLYVEHFQDAVKGQKWLGLVKKHLKQTGRSIDIEAYEDLKADLERLKLKNN